MMNKALSLAALTALIPFTTAQAATTTSPPTFGLPPIEGDPISTAVVTAEPSSMGDAASTAAPPAETSAVGEPLSIFALAIDVLPSAKSKRQSATPLYLDPDGYASDSCTAQYSLVNGQLFVTNGQQFSSGEYTFSVFAASDTISGDSVAFVGGSMGSSLQFLNTDFDNGAAFFCIPPLDPDYVYGIYEGTIDGCQAVNLRVTGCNVDVPSTTPLSTSATLPPATIDLSAVAPVTSTSSPSVTPPSATPLSVLPIVSSSPIGNPTLSGNGRDPIATIPNPVATVGDPVAFTASSETPFATVGDPLIFTPTINGPGRAGDPAVTTSAGVPLDSNGIPVTPTLLTAPQSSNDVAPLGSSGNASRIAPASSLSSGLPTDPSSPNVVYKSVTYVVDCNSTLPQNIRDMFASGKINYYCNSNVYYYAQLCHTCPVVQVYKANNTFAQRPCAQCAAQVYQCPQFRASNATLPIGGGQGFASNTSYPAAKCISCSNSTQQPAVAAPASPGSPGSPTAAATSNLATITVACSSCPSSSAQLVCPSSAAASIQSLASASGAAAAQSAAQQAIQSAVTITQTLVRYEKSAAPAPSTAMTLPCGVCPAGSQVVTVAQTGYVPHMTGAPRTAANSNASPSSQPSGSRYAPATQQSNSTAPFTGESHKQQIACVVVGLTALTTTIFFTLLA